MNRDKQKIKQLITECAKKVMNEWESHSSLTAEYEPLTYTDEVLTDEEIDSLDEYLQPSYTVSFYMSSNSETDTNPSSSEFDCDGEDEVYADIDAIPDERLRDIVTREFEKWKDEKMEYGDFDTDEPDDYDPDDF